MAHTVPLEIGMEPFPGFRLLKPLGRGSFAEVWSAKNSEGRTVALKFLQADMTKSTPTEIRALQAVRQLKHPNLTRVDRVWVHLGYIVIAMELAEGSLADLYDAHAEAENAPLGVEHVLFFLAQAADALDFLNARKHRIDGTTVAVQHCDIKPSNMLLFGDIMKLCDYGIATLMTSSIMNHRPIGTPDYAAPEIFRGRISNRTDQYALAVSYVQLCSGQLPFSDTPSGLPPTYVRPRPDLSMLPVKEQPIVARALSSMPQDRWATCGEFIDRLAQLYV
ncbi:MAG TPA: serine/threonine-protein kinase [Gemmataceae bacterium]